MTDEPLKFLVPPDHPYRKDSDFRWVLDDPLFWKVEETIAQLSGVKYEDMDEPARRLARKRYAWGRMYGMSAQMMDNRLKDAATDSSSSVDVRIRPDRRVAVSDDKAVEPSNEE